MNACLTNIFLKHDFAYILQFLPTNNRFCFIAHSEEMSIFVSISEGKSNGKMSAFKQDSEKSGAIKPVISWHDIIISCCVWFEAKG